jgi:PRTRC genetic system protein C
MEIIQIKRVFKYKDLLLTDPDESKSPNQVLEHFANIYPALSIAKVESKGIENDEDVYEFKVNPGTKG